MYTIETRKSLLQGLSSTVLGREVYIEQAFFSLRVNRFFLKESLSGNNDFLQRLSTENLEDIRDKLAPHLVEDSRFSNGIFPFCDKRELVVRIVEYVLTKYCPGEIDTSATQTIKRGNIVMKPRKKGVL